MFGRPLLFVKYTQLLVKFTGKTVNKKSTLIPFVALGMRSEGNARKKWRTNSWYLLHDNAPVHRSVLVKDFLPKNDMTTLEHPLAAAYFYLLARLNSALKGRHFCDATDTIRNATKELKRLTQNDFQECFQLKYIVAQSDYFEGNVA